MSIHKHFSSSHADIPGIEQYRKRGADNNRRLLPEQVLAMRLRYAELKTQGCRRSLLQVQQEFSELGLSHNQVRGICQRRTYQDWP